MSPGICYPWNLSRYVLPLEPDVQRMVHVFYTQPSLLAPYAKVRSSLCYFHYNNVKGIIPKKLYILIETRLIAALRAPFF